MFIYGLTFFVWGVVTIATRKVDLYEININNEELTSEVGSYHRKMQEDY